jgi:hypothetical protein
VYRRGEGGGGGGGLQQALLRLHRVGSVSTVV